jgi:polyhydroxybutyrate depolymerase
MSGGAWDERPASASVGILQINGTADTVVPLGSGKSGYGNAPAIGGVIEYWKNANGLDEFERAALSDKATVDRYSSKTNDNLVWYVEIEGGGHSWPNTQTAGFDADDLILDYFSRYVSQSVTPHETAFPSEKSGAGVRPAA